MERKSSTNNTPIEFDEDSEEEDGPDSTVGSNWEYGQFVIR